MRTDRELEGLPQVGKSPMHRTGRGPPGWWVYKAVALGDRVKSENHLLLVSDATVSEGSYLVSIVQPGCVHPPGE